MIRHNRLLFGGILALAVCLNGCAATPAADPSAPALAEERAPIDLDAIEPSTVQGVIHITGSSTVYPVTAAAAMAFAEEGSPADVEVKSTGTGGGFRRFCTYPDEEVDVVGASRSISEQEQADCIANNHEPVEFRIGVDALAVVVNRSNDFVQSLSTAQLAQIFTGQAQTWADVDPSWPAEPIALFSPGTDSGTFDYFVEEVLDANSDPLLAAPNALLSESDVALAQGITDNPYAIGYFGYAYYQENQDSLKLLAIDAGDGEVEATAETVADGSYPLARPLYIYSSVQILQERPHVAVFINYYLTHAEEFVTEVGYFPTPQETIAAAQQNLRETVN
ncbi:MAG: PstS family phosphate ABC transporter substrate-binding protein [Chloroflexales bacterium]|nr:PstS family phosphate ABC transporter substrate-binding protein [Chloroflexales bacterium]